MTTESKKLIICLDGTGNEIKENQSNVLKMFHMMEHSESQRCFYDPGVGTISSSGDWNDLLIKAKSIVGLATGLGINKNVLDAYRFIVRNYNKGDQILIFGFSRGAYTARILAAFIHMIGVLGRNQEHMCSYALRAYKKVGQSGDKEIAYRVNRIFRTHRPTISLLGCWDTVGSVIIPVAKYGYLPAIQKLPFEDENPSVEKFRHAIAIDERRRMYHIVPWKEPQDFNKIVYRSEDSVPQDIEQVWFAGVHSDVGGGYAEEESAISKFPLIWMVEEATKCGIVFRKTMMKMMMYGEDNYTGHENRKYVGPDHLAKPHDSMLFWWRLVEYLPSRIKGHFGRNRKKFLGFYQPQAEFRYIGKGATIHDSAIKKIKEDESYTPQNPTLPDLE